MSGSERREKIVKILKSLIKPVSGSYLSKVLDVSRQVIVSDVALIRASGIDIISTPKGYVLNEEECESHLIKTIACKHSKECIEDELNSIVDEGATVMNVIVEHSVYGQLTGNLHLSSRRDIRGFIKKLEEDTVNPLSQLTDGVHLHTIKCDKEEALENVMRSLKEKGYLL
ncbi:transcription repressor NadR [Paraclostridium ghonii]|uniref:Transcriptional regulator of NAD metabolism n=1 Tax=Paraclostridium ghonii TaxID=29358 RepID=A0ABU0N0D5_9FIRM|nr:transcription repressor NadR [Paeniclostridium ghonii]MDQ0556176.1 transcriptional regulator of NAD metabolism [Paeniclostridium ghonii]